MEDFISAREAAALWGISQRRVQVLCKEGRIPEAKIIGNIWVIPKGVSKPDDPRRKSR